MILNKIDILKLNEKATFGGMELNELRYLIFVAVLHSDGLLRGVATASFSLCGPVSSWNLSLKYTDFV